MVSATTPQVTSSEPQVTIGWREDIAEQAQREAHAWSEVERLSAELAAVVGPLWHMCDGYGGGVRDALDRAFVNAGYEIHEPPPTQRKPPARECLGCGRAYRVVSGVSTYVVQRQDWVKIGRAKDLESRVRGLRKRPRDVVLPSAMDPWAPLELLWSGKGDHEHQVHEAFADWHVAGEWFEAAPVVASLAGAR